jgi:hypothetical protein
MLWRGLGPSKVRSGYESCDTTTSPERIVTQVVGGSEAQKWQRGLPRMNRRPHGSTPHNGVTNAEISPNRQEIRTWQTVTYTTSPTPFSIHAEPDIYENIASAEFVFPNKEFDEFGRSISSWFAVSTISVENDYLTPQVLSVSQPLD